MIFIGIGSIIDLIFLYNFLIFKGFLVIVEVINIFGVVNNIFKGNFKLFLFRENLIYFFFIFCLVILLLGFYYCY